MHPKELPLMDFSWTDIGIRVLGNESVREKCLSLVEQTLERYQYKTGYYRNLRNSHLVGRTGEIAVANVLANHATPLEVAFVDPSKDSLADIIWKELKIDVKTWSDVYWPQWGRCIAVKQFSALKSKASHVVWCTTNIIDSESSWYVDIVGWNTIEDIESFPKKWTGPAGKQVHNFQAEQDQVRPMLEFFRLDNKDIDSFNS